MAAPVSEASLEEIASSLTEADNVAPKLRCAACNKIAYDASKLPCCQQSVCSYCKRTVNDTCPICSHTPLDPDDVKPNKSLRLTVAAYLKNILKKRLKAAAAAGDATPTTENAEAIPAAAVGATLEASESVNANVEGGDTPLAVEQVAAFNPAQEVEVSAERVAEEKAELQELDATATITQSDNNAPVISADDVTAQETSEKPGEEEGNDNDDDDDAESDTSDIEIVTGDEDKTAINPWGEPEEEYYDQDQQWGEEADQGQMGGPSFNYQDNLGELSNMFPGMNPNDMMQQMMMQMNAINPNWMNSMGMSNMDMMNNPMFMMAAMQNSMQGMGGMGSNMMFNNMNDMSGMMGGMGYNGNFGGGNGWNGMNNGAGGDFGAASGYYPDGGYNQSSHQGNYAAPHMSHHHNGQNQRFAKNNSYNQQQDSFRGSARGRGRGYGRGYHNNNEGYHGRNHSQTYAGVSDGPPLNAPTGPKAQREHAETPQQRPEQDRTSPQESSVRQRHPSTDAGAARDTTNDNQQEVSTNAHGTPVEQPRSQSGEQQQAASERNGGDDYFNHPNGTLDESYSDQRSHRGGYRGRGNEGRGGWRGRGGWQAQSSRGAEVQPSPSTDSPAPGVEGAPSGPKAMRDFNARGRGGFHGRGPSQSFSSSRHEDQPDNRPRSRDRSVSRDRSRSPSRRHSRRHRSQSPATDADYDRRKEHKRRRKYEEDYDDRHDEDQEMQDASEDKYRSSRREHERHRSSRSQRETSKDRRKHRRRSRSPEDLTVQEQQAYVNGDGVESKEKERRRDKDKYRERSRDRDRHREKERDRERDKKRSSRRDRSASPDSQHRSSHRREKEKEDREREPRDKERDSRRASAASITKTTRPEAPNVQKQLEQGFRIHGRSKEKERDRLKAEAASAATETTAPVAADTSNDSAKMQPPTGPRADRGSGAPSKFKLDLANLNTRTPSGPRGSAPSSRRPSQPATPTSAATPKVTTPIDPYEAERLKAQQARIAKEHARRNGPAPAPALAKKRSFAEAGDDGSAAERDSWAVDREREREKKRVKGRKMSYKFEDDVGRGEEERENARYR